MDNDIGSVLEESKTTIFETNFPMIKTKKKLLNKGDVIKTNPREGFWGCAIVLSEREKTKESNPKCHIAITPVVFQHNYDFSELDTNNLDVLEYDCRYRLKPNEEFTKKKTAIGVYMRKISIPLNIIGNIDPSNIYNGSLPFEPYIGLKVTFPLCGGVTEYLGMEAVINWRSINDKEALENEILESDKQHDALIARIKEEEREKRNRRQLTKQILS